MNIAVVGAQGFVGSALCAEIISRNDTRLTEICRGDDVETLLLKADIVIYSANSSKRYFAKNNPELDFQQTVEQMYRFKKLSKDKKFVLISSISARAQLNTPYGRNRRACELMLVDDPGSLCFRLGPMFGKGRPTGALYDILANNPCYVSKDTEYAYVDVAYNARKIVDLIEDSGLVELGAKNAIRLGDIKERLNSKTKFSGPLDTQILETNQEDAPDAHDVIRFALTHPIS